MKTIKIKDPEGKVYVVDIYERRNNPGAFMRAENDYTSSLIFLPGTGLTEAVLTAVLGIHFSAYHNGVAAGREEVKRAMRRLLNVDESTPVEDEPPPDSDG